MAEKEHERRDVRRRGDGGTPELGMRAGKFARGRRTLARRTSMPQQSWSDKRKRLDMRDVR
jgi:hypothetical protein